MSISQKLKTTATNLLQRIVLFEKWVSMFVVLPFFALTAIFVFFFFSSANPFYAPGTDNLMSPFLFIFGVIVILFIPIILSIFFYIAKLIFLILDRKFYSKTEGIFVIIVLFYIILLLAVNYEAILNYGVNYNNLVTILFLPLMFLSSISSIFFKRNQIKK